MTPDELRRMLTLPDDTIEWEDGRDACRMYTQGGTPALTGEALAKAAVRNARYFKENSAPQTVEELAVYWLLGYLACCVEGSVPA